MDVDMTGIKEGDGDGLEAAMEKEEEGEEPIDDDDDDDAEIGAGNATGTYVAAVRSAVQPLIDDENNVVDEGTKYSTTPMKFARHLKPLCLDFTGSKELVRSTERLYV